MCRGTSGRRCWYIAHVRFYTREHLWRAFPELDAYSDERCRVFVRSAQGGIPRRFWHWLLVGLGGLVGGMAWFWVLAMVWDSGDAYYRIVFFRGWISGVGFLLALLTIVTPFFAGLFVRDRLLHRRVRYVLRVRGVCSGCGYSLIGLPVSPAHEVTCPECGATGETDPSLGDLVTDEDGRVRFRPDVLPVRPPRVFTPGRVRFLKRAALVLGVGVPLLAGAAWGVYELLLARQASAARAARPGCGVFNDLVLSVQPEGAQYGPNAFDVLPALNREYSRVLAALDASVPPKGGEAASWSLDIASLYLREEAYIRLPEDGARYERVRLVSALFFADCQASALPGLLDELAARSRAARVFAYPDTEAAYGVLLPELSLIRRLAWYNGARMESARSAGDTAEWFRALRANLALARVCRMQVTLDDARTSNMIRDVTTLQVERLIRGHPAEDVLVAVGRALDDYPSPPLTQQFAGERLALLDTLGFLYSEPGNVRWGGRHGRVWKDFGWGEGPEGGVGWFGANRRALDGYFDEAERQLTLAPREVFHLPVERPWLGAGGSGAFARLCPNLFKAMVERWRSDLDAEGLRVLLALERYRGACGEYPRSLEELVPGYLEEAPVDPWSGGVLGYRLTPAGGDPAGGFVLYSVGAGKDNGGAAQGGEGDLGNVLSKQETGDQFDYVISDE